MPETSSAHHAHATLVSQSGDVPRYDCALASPLDPKAAQSRVLGSIGRASDADSGSLSFPVDSQTRQRCWNCGSYSHSLRVCGLCSRYSEGGLT